MVHPGGRGMNYVGIGRKSKCKCPGWEHAWRWEEQPGQQCGGSSMRRDRQCVGRDGHPGLHRPSMGLLLGAGKPEEWMIFYFSPGHSCCCVENRL